ncbi:uncharacterized protein [Spinacia oleracea]|uniref:Uncharacterized protein isoform X2 n=1 Tax=Spinacia oleracea TaxID=3562 RepID=A0A9R0J4Z0_SPIOL|nr:uncharacterized protein LOC110800311 isoform X2 [Spinacia oleracea]
MGDEMSSHGDSEASGRIPQSDSKMVVGAKRRGQELEDDSHASRKQIKTRDLQSVHQSEGYIEAVVSLEGPKKHSSHAKGKAILDHNHMSLDGNHLNLNAEDVASSANHDPLYTHRSQNNQKTKDTSDSGRTTGRLEGKDALRKWKEMKKNGFMSSSNSYGGIPAAPKQRGRKNKNEVLKQKMMEQAKKEQVDRFTKMAAPSGLLNGLNPGIINHVRNSKQVHSIIQALVKSEKKENRRQANEMKSRELSERNTEQENLNISGVHGSGLSYSMPESNLLYENHFLHHPSNLFSSGDRTGCRDSVTEQRRSYPNVSLFSNTKNYSENDILALKLASSSKVTESTSCLSNEESANGSSVDTLSVKAATVASQWLQLLHQDIKGRLAALRRSKKRVRAVITTELPFLLSKEFPPNQEIDPYAMKDSTSGYTSKATAELHQSHWSKLFNQMDNSLCEEEKQLECWINQVNEMMLHCDQGLQHVHWNTIFEMQHVGIVDNNLRSKIDDPEKDLSVRAAAASIYSTCNFLSSRENVSCC